MVCTRCQSRHLTVLTNRLAKPVRVEWVVMREFDKEQGMKYYKSADGTLINPDNVTHVKQGKDGSKFVVKFSFVGGTERELLFDRWGDASQEIDDFEGHCEKYTA